MRRHRMELWGETLAVPAWEAGAGVGLAELWPPPAQPGSTGSFLSFLSWKFSGSLILTETLQDTRYLHVTEKGMDQKG